MQESIPSFPVAFHLEDIKAIQFTIPLPDPETNSAAAFTAEMITSVLNAISVCGVEYKAVQAHGLSTHAWFEMRRRIPEVQRLRELAFEVYRQRIELAISNRAIEGWLEPVYYNGQLVGWKRKFSDSLLELQAKRHIPEYRDKHTVDLQVSAGALIIPAAAVSEEQWLLDANSRKRVVNQSEEPDDSSHT